VASGEEREGREEEREEREEGREEREGTEVVDADPE